MTERKKKKTKQSAHDAAVEAWERDMRNRRALPEKDLKLAVNLMRSRPTAPAEFAGLVERAEAWVTENPGKLIGLHSVEPAKQIVRDLAKCEPTYTPAERAALKTLVDPEPLSGERIAETVDLAELVATAERLMGHLERARDPHSGEDKECRKAAFACASLDGESLAKDVLEFAKHPTAPASSALVEAAEEVLEPWLNGGPLLPCMTKLREALAAEKGREKPDSERINSLCDIQADLAEKLVEAEAERDKLRAEQRIWYLADGSFEVLDSAEAVVEKRKQFAKFVDDQETEINTLRAELSEETEGHELARKKIGQMRGELEEAKARRDEAENFVIELHRKAGFSPPNDRAQARRELLMFVENGTRRTKRHRLEPDDTPLLAYLTMSKSMGLVPKEVHAVLLELCKRGTKVTK